MNKKCFRVIFSKTLQRFIVTSELAKTDGKSNETSGSFGLPDLQLFARIRPLTFSLFCALGFVAFSENTLAETLIIQADKSAPKNQQPIILQTANGLPQVNIQTPNEKGLSHNKYSTFDVDTKGAILNNSRTNVQTQQAGWVQGNPYLARGEAKVILNEVNSNNPSVLKGYVEVAGKKADVIIANPSGLHCDGCGVINANRATLTTGKPQIQQGSLDSFVVEKGKVSIEGKGLDNSKTDYTEILSREVKANAGVWTNKALKVVTGKNHIKRSDTTDNLQIIHTNPPLAEDNSPQFAVDVGELGGMYAGKIHLIGTEAGVGVRNAGHIGASSDTLHIDSQGRIINTGTLNANQAVSLTASKGIENTGKIENRQENIQLTTQADIKQDGSVVARGGDIHKKATKAITQQGETVAKGNITYQAPKVSASTRSLIAAGVEVKDTAQGEVRSLDKKVDQGKNITISTTDHTTLQGKNLASGNLNVTGSEVELDSSYTSTHSINVVAAQGDIQANNATLIADKTLLLKTPTTLQTQQSYLKAEKITTKQRSLNTQNAVWEQTGTDEFSLSVEDQLKNQGGTFKTQGDFTIHSQGMDNRQGRLIAGGKLTIDAGLERVDSSEGKIFSTSTLLINSGELDNSQGAIQSEGYIHLNTHNQTLINNTTLANGTGIVALGQLTLDTGKLENQNGYLASRGNQTLHTTVLNNRNAIIITEQGHLDINTQSQTLTNEQGKISAGANLTLNSGELNNQQGLIQSRQGMQVNTHQGNLNNQQTQKTDTAHSQHQGIIALGQLAVTTQQLLNQQGYILSQQNQTIKAQQLENNTGVLSSLANQTLSVNQSIENNKGRLSGQQTEIIAATIKNQAGVIQGNALLDVQLSGEVNNQSGQLKANKQLNLTATSVNNREGQIRSIDGNLQLTSTETVENIQGNITAAEASTINAKELKNQRGLVYNEQGVLSIKLQQALDNQHGKVISQDNLILKSDTLTNQQGTFYAQKRADIQATSQVDNQQGGKIHGLGDIHLHTNQLDNRGGEIRTQHTLTLNATSEINNQKVNEAGSLIESGKVLNINTAHLNNSHTTSQSEQMAQGILATTLTLTAQTLNNQQGKMHSRSQSELNVSQQIDNHKGEITGDNAVHITGSELQLNNQMGKLQAGGKLSISANAVTTNGHIEGQDIELTQQRDFITGNPIHANNNLSITTFGNLVNQHQLYADESVKLNANHITNHLNGRISSANTQLTAKGDVHNEGLINSVSTQDNAQTLIKANGRIVNTGEGRIYGDHIALQADRIENSDKNYGNGKITSAVVAARSDLDIAAREIENNTAYYLADNQVGATLFSMGNMRFGRVLNLNNQAEGKAEVLRNNSSVIEAEGNIQLNVNHIDNNNTHFSAHHVITGQAGDAITLLPKSQKLMEVFIIPEGYHIQNFYENEKNGEKGVIADQPDPRISVKNLKWVGWSRAGQYIYTNDGVESSVIKHKSDISSDKFLAGFHDLDCNEKNICQILEAGNYKKDNPIWTYFGIVPPEEDAPAIPLIEMPEEWFDEKGEFVPPIQPSKPSMPREQDFIMGRDGDINYSDYERAMSKYRGDLATYETNLKNYQYYKDNFKDYEDWGNKYKENIDKLEEEIEKHNNARIAKLNAAPIRRFWKISINDRRFDESKVLTTVPAQILAGGYLNFDSSSFTNNRSSVISGETIALKGNIDNKDEQGRHRVTDSGKSQWSYSRWRGGFKRYHQRKWDRENDYTRIIETPFDMNIFRIDENVNYTDNPLISNEHKEGATHHLSLNRLKVKGGAFSSEANQVLGSLTHHDNAQFIGFNTSTQSLPNGQGRELSRIELSNKTEIRSIQPDVSIPQNVLYRVNTNPTSQVVIETDPDFTNNKRWLSSDYMFNALRYEPNTLQKRLGDGFYEQRLVREQINRLTGRQFVGNYTDFDSQYRGLMDAGVTFARRFNLRPGIALSAKQVAQLTTDIVWLESEKIRLPNGQVENVLVPKVYAMVKKGDITGKGTLLSGNSVKHSGGEFINNGTVAGRELVRFDSDSVRNSGNIQAGAITGNISGNVENIGGAIEADRAILLEVAGNFNHGSTTHTTSVNEQGYQRTDTTIARKGLLHVKGSDGTLQIQANDINIAGADIINDGKGQSYISAKNNLNLTTLAVGFDEKMGGGNHYRNEKVQDVAVSHIKGAGDVVLKGHNIDSEGAEVEAGQHAVALAENQLLLGTAERQSEYEEYHKNKKRRLTGSSQHETFNQATKQQEKVSRFTGKDILLQSNGTTTLIGTTAVAEGNVTVVGKQGVLLDVAHNQLSQQAWEKRKKKGFLAEKSAGTLRAGVGVDKSQEHNRLTRTYIEDVNLTSEDGNVQVISQSGDVVANAGQFSAGKDIYIEGRNVTFNAALETESHQHTYSRKSVGIGISAVYNPKENFMAHYGDQANQGSAKGVVGKIITAGEALDKTSHQFTRAGMPYAKAQTERSSQQHYRENAQVAELDAKGNLTVKATEGSIRAQGARFTAEGYGSLWAKTDIDLGVATTTQSQDSYRKQKGIDIDGSRRPSDTVGLYHSKEQGNGKRITEQASLLSFGGKGMLSAEQGDITLHGTQAVSQGKMAISAGNDIRITTAKTIQSQQEASQGHAIGEAVVSETERFSGYNRKLSNQDGAAINHQSATIASLNENVEIDAGKYFHQTSGQILAKNRIDIDAEKVTFDVEHNQNRYSSHQSDLKIGQFTRVISPIIDLVQSVEQSIKNKDASDRIKAAQMMGIAAQGYNLHSAINHQDNAVLFRVETGTGLAHSRQREQGKQHESIGNRVNAKHINVTARSDKLSATHTDFTSRDEQGKRLADSSVTLTGKGVELLAGENRYQHLGKNQSYGTEVGMAFSVGAKTGWSVYAKEGFNKGKQEREGVSYQNSHIDTQTFNLNSQGDAILKGASARAHRINADIDGTLHIESLQDEHKQNSNQLGLGTHVEFGFGSSWQFSGNASLEGGRGNSKQVLEQSGFFAEDSYNAKADKVHLVGGAIASQNPTNSELTTNQITFSDIHNQSDYSATSGAISGGYGQTKGTNINPTLPLHEQGNDRSITRATLTEGKITLNKDSNPTVTTAAALGINTHLAEANQQVAQPKDINKLLSEQKVISQNLGHISTAAVNFADKQAKEAEQEKQAAAEELAKAKASGDSAKISEKQTAYDEANVKMEAWGEGGSKRRQINTAVAVVGAILSGKSTAQTAAIAVSPELNAKIHELTKESKSANLLAHAALSAVEFYATGLDPTTGALAGVASESSAMFLSEKVFGKTAEQLTAEERNLLKAASQLAGAVVGGVVGNSTETVVEGMATAKQAVENNYLFKNEAARKYELEQKARSGTITQLEQQELAEINKLDKARDVKLVSSCVDKMSPTCREESKQVDAAKASYSGSELSYAYAYPVYTAYSTKYEGDYKKVASFSDQYSILTASKEKAYADFEARFDLPKGSVNQFTQWGDAIASTTSLVGTGNIEKSALSGDFSKSVPKAVDSGNKLDVVGETTNYKTVKVDFNKSIIKGSDENYIVNNLEANTNYELSNGTKFKTNNYGYVEEISYYPVDMKMPRDKRQTQVGKEGLPTDVGGHIQACSQGGTCDRYNLFPQDANFNNSAYKKYFENITARAIKEGKEVNVDVRLIRNNPNVSRPDFIEINYSIDGMPNKPIRFKNQSGEKQ